MKRLALLSISFVLLVFFASPPAQAQRPGGRPGGGPQGRPGGGTQAQRGGPPQTPPLLRVFDTDQNGELSASEIDAAAVALRKLDQNQDGRLTAEELRPIGSTGPNGRPGQPGGAGQRDGGQRDGGQGRGQGPTRGGQRPSGQGPGGQGPSGQGPSRQGRGGDPAQADTAFANQVLAFDADKDGLLSQAELPEHMHRAFAIADADKSGKLDEAERLTLASQFRRNLLQPGGENLEMKNRPTQGRRPGGEN